MKETRAELVNSINRKLSEIAGRVKRLKCDDSERAKQIDIVTMLMKLELTVCKFNNVDDETQE